ncbi:methionine--tRNA ligase, mitochondrial isoform X2 [Prorops nasuta]
MRSLDLHLRYYATNAYENKYISTPIFYVNSGPHIGHLYSAILADAIARYNSMREDKVFLSTGTDEHGNKVEAAAMNSKLSNYEYCSKVSNEFRKMCDLFDVKYSHFVRTTEVTHQETVQHFWNVLDKRGYIYRGKYSGWYCISDEAFVSENDVTETVNSFGKKIKICEESGNPVEWTEEVNYKFQLSKFQNDLKYWLKNEKAVRPSKFHKILSKWIEDEYILKDLSISRPRSRVPWSIPVPKDNSQSIYVWLDALVNYLTVLGYPKNEFKEYWPPVIQIIGKDILKFHGIYWPAFLIAAGLEPPKTLLCHSHWTIEGKKMSKSKGNVVSPFEAANIFSEDGLRYFLLREGVPQSDGNYCPKTVQNILNSELADNLGNLVNRCVGRSLNPLGEFPQPKGLENVLQSEAADKLKKNLESLNVIASECYEEFRLHHAVDATMNTLQSANQMVNYHEPWKLRKAINNPEACDQIKAVISLALETARIAALVLYPIVPKVSTNLLNLLNVPRENRSWQDTVPTYLSSSEKMETKNVQNECLLFKKIRD